MADYILNTILIFYGGLAALFILSSLADIIANWRKK